MYNTGYPWLTRGAVEFMDDLLQPHMHVLEYGMGQSTIWMAQRAQVTSIEHTEKHYVICKEKLKLDGLKANLILHPRPYHGAVMKGDYDFILVDGRDRVKCFRQAIKMLKRGGVIMLDNSERPEYEECFDLEWPVFTVSGPDMTGTFNYPNWKTTWWICP